MTTDEIIAEFNEMEQKVNKLSQEIEQDAHLEFINSLKQYVNKY